MTSEVLERLSQRASPYANEDVAVIDRRFVIEAQLGQGGMSSVYAATDRLLGRSVALKLLRATSGDAPTLSSDAALLSVAREFHTLSSLHHPNVIRVLDYGFDKLAGPYFTMTLLDRPSNIVERAAALPDPARRVHLLAQLLRALSYVHRRGIIHRDLKPSNVLCLGERVYLADFGLAAKAGEPVEFSGTPRYMAPELWSGSPPSVASDLYAFGMIMHEVLCERLPRIDAVGAAQVADSEFSAMLQQLLAVEPNWRPQSARQVLIMLGAQLGMELDVETGEIRESYLQASEFVGRVEPLIRLRRALHAAAAASGGTFLVGGESGIGKSRLLAELRTHALVDNVSVMSGQAVVERGAPYDLWLPVLRALCLRAQLSDEHAAALQDIVPDLAELLERPLPQGARGRPATARARLHQAVAQLLEQQQHPTLILLEDLQWASQESIELLTHLTAAVRRLPVLIVGNYRDDESPGLLERVPGASSLSLQRLQRSEIAELAKSMLGPRGERSEIVDYLYGETEGNVFFVVEVVRALAEQAGGLDRIGQLDLRRGVVTFGIAEIAKRRVERVPAQFRGALQSAAVLGNELDLSVLRVLEPAIELDRWLESCANAAVLESRGDGWRFAHDKLRAALLANMAPELRAQRHHKTALALAEVYPEAHLHQKSALLAYHFGEAGEHARAAEFRLRAGDHATRLCAYDEARSHYALALEALAQLPAAPETWRRRVDVLLQQIYTTLVAEAADRNFERVAEARRLLSEIERAGATAPDDRMRMARVDYLYGRIHFYRGETAAALEHYQRVLPVALETGDEELLALPGCLIGSALVIQGDAIRAEPLLAQASGPLERLGEPFEWFRAVGYHGLSLLAQGHYEAGVAELARVRKRSHEVGQPNLCSAAYLMSGSTFLFSGDWPLAIEMLEHTLRYSHLSGDRLHQVLARSGIAWAHSHLGRHVEAERGREQARRIAAELGGQVMLNDWYLAADAEIALNAGAFELALSRARVVLEGLSASALLFSSGVAERVWGEVSALRGEVAEADEHMRRSLQLHAQGGIHVQVARTEFRWALQHMRRGDEGRGRELYASACQKLESFPCRYALAQFQRQFQELAQP